MALIQSDPSQVDSFWDVLGGQPRSPTHSSTSWANVSGEAQGQDKKALELHETDIYDMVDASGSGPGQWLRNELDTVEAKNSFARWLVETFPEKPTLYYHTDKMVPPVAADDMSTTPATIVHVAALGFSEACSLRPYPGKDVFKES